MFIGIKSIAKLPQKYLDAIQGISDERGYDGGIWIYLNPPYINDVLDCYTIHEDSIRECIRQLKAAVDNVK